ncbi:MAG: nucleotidyltransferase domain-containing protein [Bacteroidales bacterium]|nr:nucleotidyltransferase domain-containing protein [Bacteroidales bacterium]
MNPLIANKIKELEKLCLKYDIKTMYLFGSAASGHFNDDSDIDILISFKDISFEKYTDNYFGLHHDLTQLFGRKTDLLTERSLSNPYLIESIEESKVLLYAA